VAEEPALETRRLATDPLRAVLPEGHALARRPALKVNELAGEEWIVGLPGAVCTQGVMHACHSAGFDPNVKLHIGDFTTACGMVSAGLGVALIPALALPVRLPGVRCLPIEDQNAARHIWAAFRPQTLEGQSTPL